MKKIYPSLLLIISLFSCRKEGYDLKIRNADPILIVDARVESNTRRVIVDLSTTTDFLGDKPKKNVDNASVFVKINNLPESQLEFIGEGNYELLEVLISEGTKYELRIVWENKEYTSSTEMLKTIPIDLFTFVEEPFEEEPTYAFYMMLNIDLNQTDYFLTEAFMYDSISGDYIDRTYLQWDDRLYDSNPATFPYFEDYPLNSAVRVKFSHINKVTSDFYLALEQVEEQNPGSLAPANPPSNITNGAIGDFGTFATTDTIILIAP